MTAGKLYVLVVKEEGFASRRKKEAIGSCGVSGPPRAGERCRLKSHVNKSSAPLISLRIHTRKRVQKDAIAKGGSLESSRLERS